MVVVLSRRKPRYVPETILPQWLPSCLVPRGQAVPSEQSAQQVVVRELRKARRLVWHVPNGGKRDRRTAASMRSAGQLEGVPDLTIATTVTVDRLPPCALEMKKADETWSAVKDEQRRRLEQLDALGWATYVGYGADDALKKLREGGYLPRRRSEPCGGAEGAMRGDA